MKNKPTKKTFQLNKFFCCIVFKQAHDYMLEENDRNYVFSYSLHILFKTFMKNNNLWNTIPLGKVKFKMPRLLDIWNV